MKESRRVEAADRVVLEWTRWTRSVLNSVESVENVDGAADTVNGTADSTKNLDNVYVSAPSDADIDSASGKQREAAENSEEAETEVWRNVRWVQQGDRDYWFIYEGKNDPHNEDKLSNEIKTVLHVKDNVLTWIRRGATEWRHQFEAGKQFTSILQTGPLVLDVMTDTHSLDVSVESDKGTINLDYSLDLSGEIQRVQTQIRFFKEGLYEHQENLGGRG